MILREILETLERIELRLGADLRPGPEGTGAGDEWMQKGIDSILSYQAGKKEESVE